MEPRQIERILKYIPEFHAAIGEALKSGHSLDEPHVVSRHFSSAFVETSPFFQE
jgi:hypothetical protein